MKNREPGAASLKDELDTVSLACDLMLAEAVVAQRRGCHAQRAASAHGTPL
jgi:hypothetical protein